MYRNSCHKSSCQARILAESNDQKTHSWTIKWSRSLKQADQILIPVAGVSTAGIVMTTAYICFTYCLPSVDPKPYLDGLYPLSTPVSTLHSSCIETCKQAIVNIHHNPHCFCEQVRIHLHPWLHVYREKIVMLLTWPRRVYTETLDDSLQMWTRLTMASVLSLSLLPQCSFRGEGVRAFCGEGHLLRHWLTRLLHLDYNISSWVACQILLAPGRPWRTRSSSTTVVELVSFERRRKTQSWGICTVGCHAV